MTTTIQVYGKTVKRDGLCMLCEVPTRYHVLDAFGGVCLDCQHSLNAATSSACTHKDTGVPILKENRPEGIEIDVEDDLGESFHSYLQRFGKLVESVSPPEALRLQCKIAEKKSGGEDK